MNYNMKIHLPQVMEEVRQEYRGWLSNGDPTLFLNSINDIKEILTGEEKFITMIKNQEKKYEQQINTVKEKLIEGIKTAVENKNNDELIEHVGQEINLFDTALKQEQINHLEKLKKYIFGSMPYIVMDDDGGQQQ